MLDKDFKKSLEELYLIQESVDRKIEIFNEVNAKLSNLPQIKTQLFELGDLVTNIKNDIADEISKKINTEEILQITKKGIENLEFIADDSIPYLNKAIKELNTFTKWQAVKNLALGAVIGGSLVFAGLSLWFKNEYELSKLKSYIASHQGYSSIAIPRQYLINGDEKNIYFKISNSNNKKDTK